MRIFFIFLLCFNLLACQKDHYDSSLANKPVKRSLGVKHPRISPTAKDGAPSGPLPTRFNRVHPVSEPISRYGNPAIYRVAGKTYQVLRSAKGYKARGLASWYGTKFHSRKTSSGDGYDLYELTAAHKTLPIPTYVKVRNLSNGKVAIVKVNDRGPFHSGRIIDLSYGAAVKLGLMPKGTAPVEIEALTSHSAEGKRASYYLQTGAFTKPAMAKILQQRIQKLGIRRVQRFPYKQFFIVRIGPMQTKAEHDAVRVKLNQNGIVGSISMLQ